MHHNMKHLLSLSINLVYQVKKLPQRVEAVVERLADGRDVERGYAGLSMNAQAFADHLSRTDQIGFEHQLVWDERDGGLALSTEPEVLNLVRQFCVARALVDLVVEVVLARSHCADVEGQGNLERGHQRLQVIGEAHGPGMH